MEMKKENPFAGDIEVPEIVQAKAETVFSQIRSEEREENEKRGSITRYMKTPKYALAACLCAMIIFGGGISAYAAANNLSVRELFQGIWNHDRMDTVEKNVKDFEVIEERNTSTKISVEPVQVMSDSYVTYFVLKVTGKGGFQLEEDMVVGENFFFDNQEETIRSMDSCFLKKEGNAIYYGIKAVGECKDAEAEFVLDNFYLDRGSYDARGWINHNSGEKIGGGCYRVSVRCQVDSQHVNIKADGVNYRIYSMGVWADRDVLETLDNPHGETWWDTNAWVVLRDGREVAASPRVADNARGTECVLEEPVDVDEVAGLKIGERVYPVEIP